VQGMETDLHSLNKCSCNDNSSPEVSCKQIYVDVDPCPSNTASYDGEEGTCRRHNEDHKKRRDAGTEPAIIFILSKGEVADHILRVGCVKINAGRIKS
jgi:hypothetical protein